MGYSTCGVEWYDPIYGNPTVAAAICRHPAQRAGTVVRLYLFRPTQKRLLLYYVIPFNLTGYICHGAGWRWVNAATLFRVWGGIEYTLCG